MKEFYEINGKKYYLDLDSVINCVEQNEGEINIGKFDLIRLWIDQFITLMDIERDEVTFKNELSDSGKIIWNTLLNYDILKEINQKNKSYFKPKEK